MDGYTVALTDRGQEPDELEYHRVTAEYVARKERGETGPGVPHDEARRRVFGDTS